MAERADNEPTKPAKPGFVGATPGESPKIRADAGEQARPSVREEYHRRATEALREIGRLGGARLRDTLAWLEQAQPARWRWLLHALPDHLDMLWESGARLDVFQEALDRWVAGHQQAVREHARSGQPNEGETR
jgi:hypothetical protein